MQSVRPPRLPAGAAALQEKGAVADAGTPRPLVRCGCAGDVVLLSERAGGGQSHYTCICVISIIAYDSYNSK